MSQGASQKACALPLYLPYRNAKSFQKNDYSKSILKIHSFLAFGPIFAKNERTR